MKNPWGTITKVSWPEITVQYEDGTEKTYISKGPGPTRPPHVGQYGRINTLDNGDVCGFNWSNSKQGLK